jgi:hypothetical protein
MAAPDTRSASDLREDGLRGQLSRLSPQGKTDAHPDRFALYSVPEAMAERFGSLVLPVDQELVFDPEPRLQPNIATIHANDIPRFRQLTNAVLDTYRTLNYMKPSAAARSELSTLSANNSVTDAYRGSPTFDLPTWISLNPKPDLPDRRAIVGASYLRRNFNILAKLIADLPKPTGAVEISSASQPKLDDTHSRLSVCRVV